MSSNSRLWPHMHSLVQSGVLSRKSVLSGVLEVSVVESLGKTLKGLWHSNYWLFGVFFSFFTCPSDCSEDPNLLGSSLCSCCSEISQQCASGVNFISFSRWVSNVPRKCESLDLSTMGGKWKLFTSLFCPFYSLSPFAGTTVWMMNS